MRPRRWERSPRSLCRELHRTHIFTHIRWDMVCYRIRCRFAPPRFVWATPGELRENVCAAHGLPHLSGGRSLGGVPRSFVWKGENQWSSLSPALPIRGKRCLAQRLLEQYRYLCVSIDLLKMGLIRSGYTDLTPEDDGKLN